jgi:hypothetical protein
MGDLQDGVGVQAVPVTGAGIRFSVVIIGVVIVVGVGRKGRGQQRRIAASAKAAVCRPASVSAKPLLSSTTAAMLLLVAVLEL